MSKFKPGGQSSVLSEASVVASRPPLPVRLPLDSRTFSDNPKVSGTSKTELESPLDQQEDFTNTELPDQVEAEPGIASSVALAFTLTFVFLRFSFLHELIATKTGVDLHLLMIVGGLSVFAALATGNLFVALTNRICMAWFAFAGCMMLATITSIWRGGSFALFYPYLRTTLILAVLIPAVTQTTKSLVKLMKVIGWAGLATVIMGLTFNDFRTGRLELSAADSVANSNDYAAIVILVMPAIAFLTLRRGSNIVMKVVGCAALAFGCFLVLSTGSRGALISMGLSTLYLLKVGSGKVRMAILAGIPLLALCAVPFLPAEASARLATLFSGSDKSSEAAASQAQRTELLMESLRVTLKHPLLGVGPGTFQEYQAQEAGANGQRGMWHETHNSYTQVSSECGLPAFLFYISAVAMSLIIFSRGRKSKNSDIREVSSVLALMLVSFSVCMFFLAQAYGFAFPVLGGIAIAIDRVLKRDTRQSIESANLQTA